MIIETLKSFFYRDLNKLKNEIESYQNESILWQVEKEITNSAGNLCLHIIGNLNAYIGATLGNTGYIRQREQEFLQKNISKQELLSQIDEIMKVIDTTLDQLTSTQLDEEYPIRNLFNKKTSTAQFLMHLTTHLTYHLGQINYHRRLLDK